MSACRSCDAQLRWARTEKGRRIPLDFEPYTGDDPAGIYVLRDEGELAVAAPLDAFAGEPHYRSHFRSCPHAARHSHRRT